MLGFKRGKSIARKVTATCHMIKTVSVPSLQVAICYIAVTNGGLIDSYAPRFVQTYLQFLGQLNPKLIVACNGGPLNPKRQAYFDGLDCEFLPRENDGGWDIGAYQQVAETTDAELLICFGESVYFHRTGWLERIIEARMQFGPGMYGFFATHAVRAHLNTSAFACDPQLLKKYPRVLNHGARYEFEHGENAFWRRIAKGGGAAIFVTWDGFWPPGRWREPSNILNKGDNSNLLCLCNHTSRWDAANQNTRASWQAGADVAFK